MKKTLLLMLAASLTVFCSCKAEPGPGPQPETADITVTSADTETADAWYNVDGNTVTWNSAAYSGPVDIFLVSEDETINIQLADDTENDGAWSNEWWFYQPGQAHPTGASGELTYLNTDGNYYDSVALLETGNYKLTINSGTDTADSAIFEMLDASLLTRETGFLWFIPPVDLSTDTVQILNRNPWNVRIYHCLVRGVVNHDNPANIMYIEDVVLTPYDDNVLSTEDVWDSGQLRSFWGSGETGITLERQSDWTTWASWYF